MDFVEIEYCVEPSCAGWRLDRYLCHKIRRLSRTRVQRIIRNALLSDRPLKPSTLVKTGMTFRLKKRVEDEPETPTEVPELYGDDALLILDKPAGLPIHPTARYYKGTLVTLLRARYPEGFTPSPAHRLDRETSGVLVCGRSTDVCRTLMRTFVSHKVQKEYLAVVEGHPREDTFEVDAPIAEGTATIRIAVRIDPAVGKPATTRFHVLSRFTRNGAPLSLVRCFPRTGRQHQIRIHLREAGHSIVGDKIYGPDEEYFDRFSKGCLEPEAWERLVLPRHALHAALVRLPHPVSGAPLVFEAPLPQDMVGLLAESDALRGVKRTAYPGLG